MVEKIFIISCIIWSIYYSMLKGEIFGFIRKWFDEIEVILINKLTIEKTKESSRAYILWNVVSTMRNPIFDCPICMTPWHGTYIYWLIWHNSYKEWLICIIAAMGLNYIIAKLSPNAD